MGQEEHKVKQALKTEKAEALKATVEPLKLAQAAQKSGDADAEALEKEKVSLETALGELLVPMKEVGGNAKQLNKLSKQLLAIEIESSLLEAMQFALLQKPEKRGSFDAVIIQNLETQVAAKKAAMEAKLQEAAPAREERAAAVKAAQDAHDAAKEANETAIAEQKAAKDAEATPKLLQQRPRMLPIPWDWSSRQQLSSWMLHVRPLRSSAVDPKPSTRSSWTAQPRSLSQLRRLQLKRCLTQFPQLRPEGSGRLRRCWQFPQLELEGS